MLSKRLENLHPYVPGEQPTDREYIKLNANENPYPPCREVVDEIKNALSLHAEKIGLYPDPDSAELRDEIAGMLNRTGGVFCNAENARRELPFEISRDMIFCGNGSDEVLSFVFYTFFDGDRPLVLPEFTYSFYPVYCGFYGIPMNKIPLKSDWKIDAEKMTAESARTKSATILANPNAPTGIAMTRNEIDAMIKNSPRDKIFVVDEAYADFGEESCIPLLKTHENLVIVRTFSKSLSFAGMRLGFVVANPKIISALFTVKNSFNHFPVDFLTQTAGIATCRNFSYYMENAKKISAERNDFTKFLREKNWFVIESRTNFVFAKKIGRSGKEIYEAAKNSGVLIRHFDTAGIGDFVRITIGTAEQMQSLKKILSAL